MYCKASVFDRWIFERPWKGASGCDKLIFINCQFWWIFKEILNFEEDLPKWSMVRLFLICLCAAQLFCPFTLVCDCIFLLSCCIVLYCIVVLSAVLCSSACFVLQWFHPSGRSLSYPRCLLTSSRLVLAWPRLALICHVLFCSCRFRLPLRVAFLLRFLRVVFCKSFFFHAALLYELSLIHIWRCRRRG